MGELDIGLIGLAVMGENLALNMDRNGFSVAVFNRTLSRVDRFVDGRAHGTRIRGCQSIQELVSSLKRPRRVMLMVKAGRPVDESIHQVLPFLERGDIVIDGGNSHYEDTARRVSALEEKGFLFVGTGVSGGEEGALKGPSIMPGGSAEAWQHLKPILQAIAARHTDGSVCCDWLGSQGAGHFVKMVHNGIEYADMQMICEAYSLMENALGMSTDEMSGVFGEWNQGELNSYLIEITRDILRKTDPETGKPMVHVILDTAAHKGTGMWTTRSALELGVPAQTIAEALFARYTSARKEERVHASKILKGPGPTYRGDRSRFLGWLRKAVYASKICSYAQGFQLMQAASEAYGWGLDLGRIALLWRAGCIIRARFLDRIKEAFDRDEALPNLLLDPPFTAEIHESQSAWRKVTAVAAERGIPVPAVSGALAYYDSYRTARLPANLLQAQRDYFGAHEYERVDQPRGQSFHTEWLEA